LAKNQTTTIIAMARAVPAITSGSGFMRRGVCRVRDGMESNFLNASETESDYGAWLAKIFWIRP
jgi:hypothetical protein